MDFDREKNRRFAVTVLYVAAAAAAVYLVFGVLWQAVAPFAVAYVFAECFKPLVRYGESHPKFPLKATVIAVILFAALALCALLYAAAREGVRELNTLAQSISETLARIQSDDDFARDAIERINGYIPFVDLRERLWDMRGNINEEVWGMMTSLLSEFSGRIVSLLTASAVFLPKALLTTVVVIIATYYFAVDRVRINAFLLSFFKPETRAKLKRAKDELTSLAFGFLRAYSLLFLLTFAELLAAFLLMGVKYALLIALLTAIVDILPVLGTGTVLLPWAAVALLAGDYGRGVALLAVYAVITVVRQIVEPRIVGKMIGLSPILSLASMFVGLTLMGVAGLFVFPLAAMLFTAHRREKSTPGAEPGGAE